MNRGKNRAQVMAGILVGLALGTSAQATGAALAAIPSTQTFYVNDQQVVLEAYAIGGNNYVKLRDIGQAVDFNVTYDPTLNAVIMEADKPYTGEDAVSATRLSDGTAALPVDGSRYAPKVGDVIRCDDGTDYTITDVSRWDANAFADGPLGSLPTPTCDWSLLDQPELPEVETRHYTVGGQEYLFIRNLYETRRMLYTLYNAIGTNEQTWQNGGPVLRKDGAQLVRMELTIPSGSDPYTFWPWKAERITELFHSCPPGTYQMEAWDVYKNGVFQKTEYNLKVK